MANEKITDLPSGSYHDSGLTFIGDPNNGALSGSSFAALQDYIGTNFQMSGSTIQSLGNQNATASNGIIIINPTSASSGIQQYSPSLNLEGQGWKTTTTATSMPVSFRQYVIPIQGTTAPTSQWNLDSNVNTGSYTNLIAIVNNNGALGNTFTFNDNSSGEFVYNNPSNIPTFSILRTASSGNVVFNLGVLGLGFIYNSAGTFDIVAPAGGYSLRFFANGVLGMTLVAGTQNLVINSTIDDGLNKLQVSGSAKVTQALTVSGSQTGYSQISINSSTAHSASLVIANTANIAQFNLQSGSAPANPQDGDVWRDVTGSLKIFTQGGTKGFTIS